MQREMKQELVSDSTEDNLMITEECVVPIYSQKSRGWNLKKYLETFYIQIFSESDDKLELEFDLVNIGTSIANAIRRVLIAEVPSMAIEKVFLYQNTSVIPDEVLCHRLGLLPIYANATHFTFPTSTKNVSDENEVEYTEEPLGDPKENIIFELHVKCKKKKTIDEPTSLAQNNNEKLFENAIVRANQFKWIPIGKQVKIYSEDVPRIVNDGIVVAKLRPNQEIEARCHCVKGIGRDHAKFSPVSTASYRLLPVIKILRPIIDKDAEKFKSCFSRGVIGINKNGEAYVKNARKDTCSRNVLQYDELKDAVYLGKNTDYFIFNIESVGAVSSQELFITATRVLRAKLNNLQTLVFEKLNKKLN